MRLSLGQTVITRGAREVLTNQDVLVSLGRHAKGDWGDVCDEDWRSNENALRVGARILSVYRSECGVKFWIITEADRSATTILLPEEY
jgi:hypothetical protein